MNISLDQARAFDAVQRLGTIQNAAQELHKGHSAVVYLLRTLEEQTGIQLFDRSGHKNRITLQGEIIHRYCRQLLTTTTELEMMCKSLKGGWEPSLKIIYDGVIDFNQIGKALFMLNEMKAPTEVKVLAAHLHEVEAKFDDEKADMMLTILPIQKAGIAELRLKPIRLLLVAHRGHELGKKNKVPRTRLDLNRHTYIKVRDTAGQLGLSTEFMNFDSCFFVNDFYTKKMAIMNRLGFGWLPEYLIAQELQDKTLTLIKSELSSEHKVEPCLYHRHEKLMGKATVELLKFIKERNALV